jgi:hypothetical protein
MALAFSFSKREFEMTENQSKNRDKKRLKVTVNEHRMLLDRDKSKRLSEMNRCKPKGASGDLMAPCQKNSLCVMKDEKAIQLAKAREKIDCRINELMSLLPEGKKNKLFCLRYGTVDGIKRMAVPEAFQRLGVDGRGVKLRMLAGMNYYGQTEKESVES